MRDGACSLDTGHRGRCSTVTHYCDLCGKRRRGASPHAQEVNPFDGCIEVQACWFCVRVAS